jgi:hypothetical protein
MRCYNFSYSPTELPGAASALALDVVARYVRQGVTRAASRLLSSALVRLLT